MVFSGENKMIHWNPANDDWWHGYVWGMIVFGILSAVTEIVKDIVVYFLKK